VLAYLRKGETFAELATAFGVGSHHGLAVRQRDSGPAGRPTPEAAPGVRDADKAGHAYLVIDGTLIPVERVAADQPFYSGKHHRQGMNLQVIVSPDGDIVWVSGPLPGAAHDLTAAQIWGIIAELAVCALAGRGDKGYLGEEDIRTPLQRPERARLPEGGQPRACQAPRTRRTR
jgi:hypothetical protein